MYRRAQIKSLKHAWAVDEHVGMPFVSEKLGSVPGRVPRLPRRCLFAWLQAGLEAHFFEERGDRFWAENGASALVEVSKWTFRRWDAHPKLAVWLSGERQRVSGLLAVWERIAKI